MANRLKPITIKQSQNKRYYKNIEYPNIPVSIDDIYIITNSTDRLDLLANDFYGDPHLWWIISRANPEKIKRDSFFMKPGVEIRIPSKQRLSEIYNEFEKINK